MQSGKLRSLVEIQYSTNNVWTKLKDVYVRAEFTSGSESLDSETGYATTNVNFTARRDTSITTKHRLIYEGRTYYIEAIIPDRTDRRNQVMNCVARDY